MEMTTTLYSTQVVTQAAILNVIKTGSVSQVTVGDRLIYAMDYSNVGNQPAADVILADTLPAGSAYAGASPPPASVTSQSVTWQLGTLDVGVQGQVTLTVTVGGPANRTLHNVADITGQPGSLPGHAELDTPVRLFMLYLPIILRG
jgi:uncharacterized repeat protein (TIGR01451 family)